MTSSSLLTLPPPLAGAVEGFRAGMRGLAANELPVQFKLKT